MKKTTRQKINAGLILALLVFWSCSSAQAQQRKKVPVIGFVSGEVGNAKRTFSEALRELGYVEGKDILIEHRNTRNRNQILQFVGELVKLKVDVLVARPQPAIRAAKQLTKTIPIVMVTTQDPVALGFINSLARPGGNITGVTTLQRELSGKRLELLREVLPGISHVAALMNATSIDDFKKYEVPARDLKIHLQPLGVQGPNLDLDDAFQKAVNGHANAIIAITNAALNPYVKRIAALAIKHRLPLMGERSDYVAAGGLLSYSANNAASYRHAAIYVDKILKGANPADLPIEQPTNFDLVINLKTAKALGLKVPPELLMEADRVIE